MARNPFSEIERMFERMSRQFEGMEESMFAGTVAVDVEDRGDAYVVTADLPGFDREEVRVELSGETLTIGAEHDEATEQRSGTGTGEKSDERETDEGQDEREADEGRGVRGTEKERDESGVEEGRYLRRERRRRSVSRSVRLPDAVDADATDATYRNGVLTVIFPKLEAENDGTNIPIN